jgi:hypothetical protein
MNSAFLLSQINDTGISNYMHGRSGFGFPLPGLALPLCEVRAEWRVFPNRLSGLNAASWIVSRESKLGSTRLRAVFPL